jgi:hypothetical protein
MKHNKKLVILDANFLWTQELFSSGSDGYDVLLMKPVDFRAFYKRHGHFKSDLNPVNIKKNVWECKLCMPPGWLFHYWPLTRYVFKSIIKRFSKESDELIVVISYPYYQSLWDTLPNCKKIYYCFDYYDEYWPGRKERTVNNESKAIQKADLVLCTALTRKVYFESMLPSLSYKFIHLPHGTSSRFLDITKMEKSAVNKPKVGYIGGLNARFDFEYLYQVAYQMPEVTFFIGGGLPHPSMGTEDWYKGYLKCKACANIRFIGYINNKEIPNWLVNFDVLIMPYAECDFNTYACPMKLWDYMATGKPLLANTAVPEILLWREVVKIGENLRDFVEKLNWLINNQSWKKHERIKIATGYSWKNQFNKIFS